jgi:flagellar hook-length control protein FliK
VAAKNADEFAHVLGKASSESNKPKDATNATKTDDAPADKSKAPKHDDAGAQKVDEKTPKQDDTTDADASAEDGESSAEPKVEQPVAPTLKPLDVAALLPTLAAAVAPTAPASPVVAVDPAAVATAAAPVIPAPVLTEEALIPLATTLVPATTAESTPVAVAVVANSGIADTTDPAAALPAAPVAAPATNEAEAPTLAPLPAPAAVAAEAPKDAQTKASTPAIDPALAALLNSKTEASAPTAAVAATKAVAQNAHAEPYKQVMQIVHPLRGRDGEHNITISLAPENLGRVEVQINIQSTNINMQMNADNPNARQMLRDSMNELRTELNQSGLNAGSLDVGSQDAGQQSQQSAQSSRGRSWDSQDDIELTDEEFFARLATTSGSVRVGDGPLDIRA